MVILERTYKARFAIRFITIFVKVVMVAAAGHKRCAPRLSTRVHIRPKLSLTAWKPVKNSETIAVTFNYLNAGFDWAVSDSPGGRSVHLVLVSANQ